MVTPLLNSAVDVRLAARAGDLRGPTAGLCPGYVQANLLIVPRQHADDFRGLCRRNPVACPLLAESRPGEVGFGDKVARDINITTDVPGYNVYRDGKLLHSDIADVSEFWTADSVAFLIGCSFTFEDALVAAGLGVRHIEMQRNVPMYHTSLKLMPSGDFGGNVVVSMRPYRAEDIERVRATTRPYAQTHGEPIAWGWNALETLGIKSVQDVDFGDAPVLRDGEVPCFWACGVTPQLSLMSSPAVKGIVIGHAPGKMVCLDLRIEDVVVV